MSPRDLAAPLVGRAEQLEVLDAALARAAAGRPGAVLVAGEAGVGKSRLLAELIEHATAAGATVLVGHCLDIGEVGLPYLPFTEALDARAGGDRAGGAAAVWSVLADPVADAGQLRLFESVLSLLARAADDGPGPLLLVLEDLHWADRSSRELLAFLLARLRNDRILVVGSYRSDDLHRRHPLRPLLAQLARSPVVERLAVPAFDADEMAAYLRACAELPVEDAVVTQIFERSQGNAYYARELLESVGSPDSSAGGPGLSAALADVLLVRYEQLPPESQLVVRAASVGGRPLSQALLARLTGLDEPTLEAALHGAVAHQVFVPAAGDRYAFRHMLLSEAVYADLLPGERVRLHAAFARAIADPAGSADSADFAGSAAELAHHRMASHDLPGALTAAVRAATEAEALDAPAEAWQQLERALQLWDAVPDAAALAGLDVVELALRAAAMASRAGALDRAAALAELAVAGVDPLVEPARAADSRTAHAQHLLHADRTEEALAVATEALRLATGPGSAPTPGSAWSAAVAANVLRVLDRGEEARELAERALAIAGRTGAAGAEADALVTLAALHNHVGSEARVAELLAQAGERARAAGDVSTEMRVSYALAADRYDAGDLGGALVLLAAAVQRCTDHGLTWSPYGLELRSLLITARFVTGDWPGSDDAAEVAGPRPPEPAAARLAAAALQVAVARGTPTAAETVRQLDRGAGQDPVTTFIAGGSGIDLLSWTGEPRAALDRTARTLRHLDDTFEPWALGGLWICALGLAAAADLAEHARRGRDPAAERSARDEADRLLERAVTTAAKGPPRSGTLGPEGVAWLRRAEAEHARATGRDEVAAWRAAADAFGYGHVYEQARSRWRLSRALLLDEDREAAAVQARLAHAAAARLGAGPLRAAIEELARRGRLGVTGRSAPGSMPSSSTPGSSTPGEESPLTPREQAVLVLLAAGRSNRQIGEQLFMAEKTASVHVSRILAKLAASTRAEAVSHAYDRGLLA